MAVAVDNRRDVISIVEGLNRRILAIPFDAGLALEAEPTPVLPQRDCAVTPDLAVSPERIERAPGATAVLEIALRNVGTAPHGCNDIVLSLSDGLRVVETPGMTTLVSVRPCRSLRSNRTSRCASA